MWEVNHAQGQAKYLLWFGFMTNSVIDSATFLSLGGACQRGGHLKYLSFLYTASDTADNFQSFLCENNQMRPSETTRVADQNHRGYFAWLLIHVHLNQPDLHTVHKIFKSIIAEESKYVKVALKPSIYKEADCAI